MEQGRFDARFLSWAPALAGWKDCPAEQAVGTVPPAPRTPGQSWAGGRCVLLARLGAPVVTQPQALLPTVSVAALRPLPRWWWAAGPGAGALCATCCLFGSGGYRHVLPMGTTSQTEISFFLLGHTLLLKKPAKCLMEKNMGLCGRWYCNLAFCFLKGKNKPCPSCVFH